MKETVWDTLKLKPFEGWSQEEINELYFGRRQSREFKGLGHRFQRSDK